MLRALGVYTAMAIITATAMPIITNNIYFCFIAFVKGAKLIKFHHISLIRVSELRKEKNDNTEQ